MEGKNYEYHYRLFDRHQLPVVSIAVFTGLKNQSRPNEYSFSMLGTELSFKYKTYQIFDHTEEELIKMDNPFALVVIAAQQEALYNDLVQDGLFNTRIKIVRALNSSEKFDYEKTKDFLYFLDQLVPLTDSELKRKFDQHITKLFGGNITMGIMEAVREQILDEGIEKGIEKGMERGELKKALETALEMKNDGQPIEKIIKYTKLTIEQVESL
jgi:predicted transposase/invertase (TIGR01784 family)